MDKGTKAGKVIAIDRDFLTYEMEGKKPAPAKVKLLSVLVVFNDKGNFIVPSKLNFADPESEAAVNNFLKGGVIVRNTDEIITLTANKIRDNISKEDNKYVYLSEGNDNRLDKRNLIAIIYRDGRHKLLRHDRGTADILWANRPVYEAQPRVTDNAGVSKKTVEDKTPVPDSGSKMTTSKADTPRISAVGVTRDAGSAPPATPDTSFVELTGGVSQEEFANKAVSKARELTNYLKVLYVKGSPAEQQESATNAAISLFAGEASRVFVSSLNSTEDKPYKVRDYLIRIKMLPYDRVEVKWTKVYYVSQLHEGPDHKWYGSVTFEQVFTGYLDNQVVYSDISKKKIDVVLKVYEKSQDGKTVTKWDVLFSDIAVVATLPNVQ